MSALLSVIIPIYNSAQWIDQTLESLYKQNYTNIEIICVDDGSVDDSLEHVTSWQEKLPSIRIIRQDNAGVSAARNRGIDEARGEYIAFIDADDYVDPTIYKKMISLLESTESDISFCQFVRFWSNGKVLYTVETNLDKLVDFPHDIKYFLYSKDGTIQKDTLYTPDIHGAIWRSVYKAEIIKNNSLRFQCDLKFAEDQIFILSYLLHCSKICYVPEPLIWYRGWTKPWVYRSLFDNMMNLCRYQCEILQKNTFYSEKQRNHLIGYCKYSAFLAIINQELMFRPDADKALREYYKNTEFVKLNSFYNFCQKQKFSRDFRRLALFVLLKLRLFSVVKKIFPNKKYMSEEHR